jgi:DNA-binding HxlR family transcriptional regulator
MLIQELKALVEVGILHKQSYNEVPPKVEYSLTVKGQKAIPVIETLRDFGKDYF